MSHSDNALSYVAEDTLDRRGAVNALEALLADPRLATPMVVGIYGGWGTGKTSVMQMLRRRIEGLPDSAPQPQAVEQPRGQVVTLWFDSWKYARQQQSLWRALLLSIIEALRARLAVLQEFGEDDVRRAEANLRLDEARNRLYRSLTVREQAGVKVNWWGALPLAADAALTAITAGLSKQVAEAIGGKGAGGLSAVLSKWFKGGDTKEAVKLIEREASERYVEHVQSLEQFQAVFNDVLALVGIGTKRTLFVFVDDLDRCLPEDAVAALEAIKLFLDLPGCVFVLGMDKVVVEQGIRQRYKDVIQAGDNSFRPRDYLDKIIQVPFNLPPLGEQQILHYLRNLGQSREGTVSATHDLIEAAAPPNPRSLKRVLNVQQLVLLLAGWQSDELGQEPEDDGTPLSRRAKLRYLTKLVLLQTCFDEVYRSITLGEFTLHQLESIARKQEQGTARSMELLTDPRLARLLDAKPHFVELPSNELSNLITLSTLTVS